MEYDTSGTRLVGKNSASCYVFCPTSEDDAGKEVRIELTTNTAKYSGVVNTVYCGDEAAIWGYLFQTYGLEMSLLFFCCLPESLRSFLGFLSGLPIRRNLIWNIWAGAFLWQQSGCLVSPRCAAGFFESVSTCNAVVCNDHVKSDRNRILYGYAAERKIPEVFGVVESIAFLNALICSAHHILGIADYIETLPVAHVILAGSVLIGSLRWSVT